MIKLLISKKLDVWMRLTLKSNIDELDEIRIKIKINEFSKMPDIIHNHSDALLYVLNFKIINISKVPIIASSVFKDREICIADGDDCLFDVGPGNGELIEEALQALEINEHSVSIYSMSLLPKIEYEGSLFCWLPDEPDVDKYLYINDGIVEEI